MKNEIIIIIVFFCLFLFTCTPKKNSPDSDFSHIQLPVLVPEEDIVLQFSGLINPKRIVSLDLTTIMVFPQSAFISLDPWDRKNHEFTGVALFPLLKRIGMGETASKIDVIAKNDYQVTMGIKDISQYEYILAYQIDKQVFKGNTDFKNRGTLAIAINFDKYTNLDIEIYKFHLVWQVKEIIIR